MDDLLIGTGEGSHSFVQAKRTISLSDSAQSELGAVVDQFLRQFFSGQPGTITRPWSRGVDYNRDRFVLATSPQSPANIRLHLREVLDRLRSLTPGQRIADSATNDQQRHALGVISEQVCYHWRHVTGQDPSSNESASVLRLMHVAISDVEPMGSDERGTLDQLAGTILVRSEQAATCWAKLLEIAADLSQRRAGIDQATLRRVLEDSGIALKSSPRFERDINRFREYSRATLQYLAPQSRISIAGVEIQVERKIVETLRHVAETDSLVVVGLPGAGKSGVLHKVAQSYVNAQRDVVFLAVDELAGKSLGELRIELGLEHELVEALGNWSGEQPGFLIIDALDAARGDPIGAALQTLIQALLQAGSRWRVVLSIRKYDLRYNSGLRQLFRGNFASQVIPAELKDTEYSDLRHLNVPVFSDEELGSISSQSHPLAALLNNAPHDLRELLRVPFNLKLAAEILESGVNARDLEPIRTQTELLDRYWEHRVLQGTIGSVREQVLKRACERMISSRRLRTERLSLATADSAAALEELLSNHVLMEWEPPSSASPTRQIITFAHHILFDFAICQLYLPYETDQFVAVLSSDPDLVIIAHPSLVMRYEQMWRQNRAHFWSLIFTVCSNTGIPQFAKLIGAGVAAESADSCSDLAPMVDRLQSREIDSRIPGETALRYLAGALAAGPRSRLVGSSAGPFCEFLNAVANGLRKETAGSAMFLLRTVLQRPFDLTKDQLEFAGRASRNLLAFAWSLENRVPSLVTHALRSVCETFTSNSAQSTNLLQRCIEPEQLKNYGYEEIHTVASYVKDMAAENPEFVSEVYGAVFAWDEPSVEKTDISSSQIFSLTSNRRQDYNHAKWQLARDFHHFVSHSPVQAARAMATVMDGYAARQHSSSGNDSVEQFEVNGLLATLASDYSYVWDEGWARGDDDEMKVLHSFFSDFERRIQDPEQFENIARIVDALVQSSRQAVIWRRLLRVGTKYNSLLGNRLRALAWAMPILRSMDTKDDAAEFVAAIFPLLDESDRRKVEDAIMSLTTATYGRTLGDGQRDQEHLLRQINPVQLVTPEARTLSAQLATAGESSSHGRPAPRVDKFMALSGLDEGMFLRELGVSPDTKTHKDLLKMREAVETFRSKHLNSNPTLEETVAIIPSLEALWESTKTAGDEVDPTVQRMVSTTIAAACTVIARADYVSCDTQMGRFLAHSLLQISRATYRDQETKQEKSTKRHSLSALPLPRREAASGLVLLASHKSCCTSEILNAISLLGSDASSQVRLEIAGHLMYLHETAPDDMWLLLGQRAKEETDKTVLEQLAHSLNPLAWKYPDQSAGLSNLLLVRAEVIPDTQRTREFCINTLVGLYIWLNHQPSRVFVDEYLSVTSATRGEVPINLAHLREPLMLGVGDTAKPEDDAIRMRAISFFDRITCSACEEFTQLLHEEWTEASREEKRDAIRRAARVIDHAASELFFASRVFDAQQGQGKVEVSLSQQQRFYRELSPTIDKIVAVGIPSAVQHIVELLEVFVPFNPKRIFLQLAAAVESGQRFQYQYEQLAVGHVVGIVERFLAEYRSLLQEDAECRAALRTILDAFVDWPEAQRLSYRLGEIFR